jgi:O-antigen/teichoic acid export membrane protein
MLSKIYRIWSGAFVIRLVALLLSFGSSWLLTQVMTDSEYGSYVYILSIVGLLAGMAAAAFDDLAVRLVSAYQTNSHFALLQGFWRVSGVVTFGLSVLLLFVWKIYLHYYPTADVLPILGMVLCNIPLLAMLSWLQGLLLGSRHTILSQLPENIFKSLLLLLALLAFWLYRTNTFLSLSQLFLWQTWINISVLVVTLGLCWRYFWRDLPREKPAYAWSYWNKNAVIFLCISSINLINIRADILALGTMVSPHELGYYNIAAKLSELLKLGFLVSNLVFAPIFASLFAEQKLPELEQLAKKSSRLMAALGLVVVVAFAVVGKYVLSWWGTNFVTAYPVLLVLLLGQWVNLAFGAAANVLQMTGKQSWIFNAIVITTLLNVALNVLLIPHYGTMGAAIATSLSTIIKILIWNAVVYRYWRIRVGVW